MDLASCAVRLRFLWQAQSIQAEIIANLLNNKALCRENEKASQISKEY